MFGPSELFAIRSVRAVDPGQGLDATVDVVIEHGRIRACAPGAAAALPAGTRSVEGRGRVVMPALIDLRARLGEPGFEHRETLKTGLTAAAAGGFAYVCGMPDTAPIHDEPSVTRSMLASAREVKAARLLPLAAATAQLRGEQLTNLAELKNAGAVAVSNGDHFIASANVMRRLLQYAESFGLPVFQHPSEPSLSARAVFHEGAVSSRLGLVGSPRVAESIALSRDIELAAATGAQLHAWCLSAGTSVPLLRAAKARGVRISADVAVHHLLFDESHIADFDVQFRVDPPLREASDRSALIAALADGSIDCIVTDHRPQTALDRNNAFPEAEPGFVGLEVALSAVWSLVSAGQLTASRAVEALSLGPARVLGLRPPSLRVGEPATLTLFDPTARWTPASGTWFSKCRNTPLFPRELAGKVLLTTLEGGVLFQLEERS